MKSKSFCAFVDFKQAFDYVWRDCLWSKLMEYNVDEKQFRITRNMYNDITSCVSMNGDMSFFSIHSWTKAR